MCYPVVFDVHVPNLWDQEVVRCPRQRLEKKEDLSGGIVLRLVTHISRRSKTQSHEFMCGVLFSAWPLFEIKDTIGPVRT